MTRSFVLLSFILLIFVYSSYHLFSSKIINPPWYKHFPNGELPKISETSSTFKIWDGIVNDPKTDLGLEYKNISFPSFQNGKTIYLQGWLIEASEKKLKNKVGVIFAHGGGVDRRNHLRHSKLYNQEGFNVLLFDFNAHGISGGQSLGVSYGYREHVDILNAVKYVRQELGWEKVIVSGNSVGSAATIIAAAKDQQGIDIVIVENPFTHVFDMWMYAIKRLIGNESFGKSSTQSFGFMTSLMSKISSFIPDSLIHSLLKFTYWRIAGSEKDGEWSPKSLISTVKQPIMFLHGKEDTVIPFSHSEELYASAVQPKRIWICESSHHGQIYNGGMERYQSNVIKFIKEHL
jgi:uncharacterized protein